MIHVEIDKKKILERGHATQEECDYIVETGVGLEKILIEDSNAQDPFPEGIWVYPLEESDVEGQDFRFLFFNQPLQLGGQVIGKIGIAASNGKEERAVAERSECIEILNELNPISKPVNR